MARMYSEKKGKHGSTKPVRKTAPTWLKYSPSEVENLVVKLAKEGNPSQKIGLILRDTYGIPSVRTITGKKILTIIKNAGLNPSIPEDLKNLIKRVLQIIKHLETNRKDMTAKRGLQLTESKIRKLVKYYKAKKVLPEDWTYSTEQAKFLFR